MWRESDSGTQRVAKGSVVTMLVKAIQELSAEIEELKNTKCKCNEE